MHRLNLVSLVFPALLLPLPVPGGEAAGDGKQAERQDKQKKTLILNENCYWRMYYTFAPQRISPERLKAEGEKWLGEKQFKRLQQLTDARNKHDGRSIDWIQDAVIPNETTGFSFDALSIETRYRLRTTPPPSDWMRFEFNDSDWPRHKRFFASGGNTARASMRTRFEVPDPARIQGLTLELAYRGGVVAYLNGQELARGHLPTGVLGPDVTAEEYPVEAYFRKDGEYCELVFAQKSNCPWEKKRNGVAYAGELPSDWTKMLPCQAIEIWGNKATVPEADRGRYRAFDGSGRGAITRDGLERIVKLRDRTTHIPIPAALLRKGPNVLAIECRAAPLHPLAMFWQAAYSDYYGWSHGAVLKLELHADEHDIPSPLERLPGVQVWVEDIHRRLYAPDYCESNQPANLARIVGARNGAFGAQLALGSDHELTGVKVTAGELKGPAGTLGAPTVLYSVPHLITELRIGDNGRRVGNSPSFTVYPEFVKSRYGSVQIPFFEHLTGSAPEKIPARTCYAIWLSVNVPAGTVPGRYAGTVKVEAAGMDPVEVPLEMEVLDWRIPAPEEFVTVMGLEQSPYSVADQYKVPVWSDEHFRLLEKTFAYLARINNSWLNIPVLLNTEFGNRADSPLRITRKKDGSYAFDFAIVDRYLDLAIKHCGRPQVANFIVLHAGNPGDNRMARSPMDVMVCDEATGKAAPYAVDRRTPDKERRVFYKALANATYEHMRTRGLEKTMYWGYTWDGPGSDPGLYAMLAEFQPQVFWTKGSHSAGPSEYVKVPVTAYNPQVGAWFTSKKGWKRPELWLAYPRYWGTVIDCNDYSPPFCFRMMTERAIASGARGISRVGVDYWGDAYLRGHVATYPVGVPNLFVLFPGKDGPETGTRFELLREGLQETEARIFLEQAAEKLTSPEHREFVDRVTAMLNERLVETLIDSPASSSPELAELCAKSWQLRSRKLYQAAADAARRIGLDASTASLSLPLPARGMTRAALALRNWTSQPRAWKLTAKEDWILPEKSEGFLNEGQQALHITLDAAQLFPEPGKEAKGTLLLTDVASGRTDTIEVKAQVSKVLAVRAPSAVNLLPGTDSQTAVLFNYSSAELAWNAGTSLPGLLVEPTNGKLAAGSQANIVLKARPGTEAGAQKGTLTIAEEGGTKCEQPLTLYVLAPYQPPAKPGGAATPLSQLPKEMLKSYRDGRGRKTPVFFQPKPDKPDERFTLGKEKKAFPEGLAAPVPHEMSYSLEGREFTAFAAEVGPAGSMSDSVTLDWAYQYQFSFELYADGKLVAQSGLMSPTDGPRLLVAGNLSGVKELKLVTRADQGLDSRGFVGCWGDPAFYR